MKRLRIISIILAICVMFVSSGTASLAMDYGDYLNSSVEFMQDMYYQGMTDTEAFKAALKGIFGNLDPYSGFFDDEETKQLNISLEGNFVGIGASLEKNDEGILIIKVYESSPAEKAGLLEGDVILAVDGKFTRGREADIVAAEIRGDAGTQVTLTIKRQSEFMDVTVTRGLVVVNPVEFRFIGKTAYIHIDTFNSNTAEKFGEAMDAVARMGTTRIILDLRDNPGGFVDQAVSVAKRLIPKGLITKLDFKSERLTDMSYYSSLETSPYIIAVLVDENSASASEILASAIQDAGNGILIGQKTYGKGVVQNMFSVITPEAYIKYHDQFGVGYISDIEWMVYHGVFPTADEILGTIKITTGHYLTRNGKQIQDIGLNPDINVEDRTNPNGIDISLVDGLANNTGTLALNAYDDGVYQAERILRAAGYFAGTPDKLLDAEAQAAIKKFQADQKLGVSGEIDSTTREKLNLLLDDLRIKNDPQYTKALEFLDTFAK